MNNKDQAMGLNWHVTIMRAAYNKLWAQRRMRKRKGGGAAAEKFRLDVFKTHPNAEKHFYEAARMLKERGIDPARYVKVLAHYGLFETKGVMPPTGWLAKPEALEVYEWKSRSEAKRFPGKKALQEQLDQPEMESIERIDSALAEDEESIAEDMKFGWTFEEVLVYRLRELSSWFLARCPETWELDLISALDEDTAAEVRRCAQYLARKSHRRRKEEKFIRAMKTYESIRRLKPGKPIKWEHVPGPFETPYWGRRRLLERAGRTSTGLLTMGLPPESGSEED